MRIRRGHFEGLLSSFEAQYIFECPKVEDCWIESGEIRVERSEFLAPRGLRDPELFLSFARLGGGRGEPSNRSIKQWVLKYGLPRWRGNGHEEAQGEAFMFLEDFKEEARCSYRLLKLYSEIKGRELDEIRARVADPQCTLDERLQAEFRSSDYQRVKSALRAALSWGQPVNEVKDNWDLFFSLRVLAEALTQKMRNVRLRLSADDFDLVTQSWRCLDLPSAMYLQFYLLVTDHRTMNYCEYCGSPFLLTRKDKIYCNSTCRSRARHNN